jgi:uncharacterized protein
MTQNSLFPIFLKLEQLHVLIVGGGFVGMEKLSAILNNSPLTKVTLVGEKVSQEVHDFVANFENITIIERIFVDNDLNNKDLVIVATNFKEINTYIMQLAKSRKILVNVADTPSECDFYLGSIVQKGDLKIAISTNGKSPTVAKRLKEVLNEAIPLEMNDLLQNMTQIRSRLSGDFSEKVKELNRITKGLVTENNDFEPHSIFVTKPDINWKKIATIFIIAFGVLIFINLASFYVSFESVQAGFLSLDHVFWMFVLTGFVAQLIDGLLGMGYGVTSSILLMSMNVPLAIIGGSVHTAEIFSSGISGYSHYRFGNVNMRLFKVMVAPGVIGAVLGALALIYFGEKYAHYVKPILAVYSLFLGIRILSKALFALQKKKKVKNVGWLALAGGFVDSFGGGGWGPLVTSTLLSSGRRPNYVIGSVSLTEFFVTLASAFTFFTFIGITQWQVLAGLIVGGVVAAPIAARLAGRLPIKWMFIGAGCMVIFWSLRVLLK